MDSWDDIHDGTRFGPAAPQTASGGMTDQWILYGTKTA